MNSYFDFGFLNDDGDCPILTFYPFLAFGEVYFARG